MDTQNTSRQLRYLEEVRIPLHRAGFETLPLEGAQLPVLWNGAPLCRITGKGSVFYRREDADTPQAEDALFRVEDIAAKTLEYMTTMESAPQLKASGLDGDYRILADFGGTVLAGTPSKHGVQFVTWDWDYDRTGVSHGHYCMENYDGAKQDFATRSGLIQKEQLFSPEQLTEIFRCCADSVDEDFFELTDTCMKVNAVPRQAQYLALTHTGEQCQDEQRFKSVPLYSGQKCGDLRVIKGFDLLALYPRQDTGIGRVVPQIADQHRLLKCLVENTVDILHRFRGKTLRILLGRLSHRVVKCLYHRCVQCLQPHRTQRWQNVQPDIGFVDVCRSGLHAAQVGL